MISLRQALMLDDGGVVSLVGAGGKTTLMFRLAHELAAAGESVLTTTTTKIFFPTAEQSACFILAAAAETIMSRAESLLADQLHLTAAAGKPRGADKLLGLSPEVIDTLWDSKLFRWILVEADGSARRPLKAPAAHEPVIPGSTTRLVGVLGLSAVNKPMTGQWVHRPELFAKVTGIAPGNPITEVALHAVLTSEEGIFKGAPERAVRLAFLNQAELPGARLSGLKITALMARQHAISIRRVVLGCARLHPAVLGWTDIDS